MRIFCLLAGFLIALNLCAQTTLVTSAPTAIKAYAKADESYKVILIFDENQYLGLNPVDNTTRCQFWTYSEAVFDSALTAMAENSAVKLVYEGQDGASLRSCQVVSLSLMD